MRGAKTVTYLHAVSICDMSPEARAIHEIRLSVSRFDEKTGRFGRDQREHNPMSQNGKLLANLFQTGTALVASQDGTTLAAVVARSAERAAAAVAIREIRAGRTPTHNWSVSMRNKSGESHSETVWFGFDNPNGAVAQDETEPEAYAVVELSLAEIAALDCYGIDDSDMDGWQDRNWDAHIERLS